MSELLGTDLDIIRACLKRGDVKEISKENNVTADYVSKVLAGKRKSLAIITAAYEKAIQNKSKERAKMEALHRIL